MKGTTGTVLLCLVLGSLNLTLAGSDLQNHTIPLTNFAFDDEDPPLWHKAPGHLNYFPVIDNKTLIDPWNYLHRLGMYKLILEHSRHAMDDLGYDNSGNVLWGLPLQHGWQYRTGRLRNYDTKKHWNCPPKSGGEDSKMCVAASSWWACMNYNLNVVPFLAAVEAGLFNFWKSDIVMKAPDLESSKYPYQASSEKDNSEILNPHQYPKGDHEKGTKRDIFCKTTQECSALLPKAFKSWTAFFELVIKLNNHSTEEDSFRPGSSKALEDDVIQDPMLTMSPKESELLRAMWEGHVESITESLALYTDRLQYVSQMEQKFGQGWGHLVGFIAATRFATNYNNTREFQELLPPRLLTDKDDPPNIADMSKGTNRALTILLSLYKWDKRLDGLLERLWWRAMCTEQAREIGRQLMAKLMTSSLIGCTVLVIRLIRIIITVPCPAS